MNLSDSVSYVSGSTNTRHARTRICAEEQPSDHRLSLCQELVYLGKVWKLGVPTKMHRGSGPTQGKCMFLSSLLGRLIQFPLDSATETVLEKR